MTILELRNKLFSIVENSGIQISGDFYSGHEGSNNRASSSILEDVVTTIVTGTVAQDQEFLAVVNTFVQDIDAGDEGYNANDLRLAEIQKFWSNYFEDYYETFTENDNKHLLTIALASEPTVVALPDINQHFVSVRLNLIVDKF